LMTKGPAIAGLFFCRIGVVTTTLAWICGAGVAQIIGWRVFDPLYRSGADSLHITSFEVH
jgi:hypothetical protein